METVAVEDLGMDVGARDFIMWVSRIPSVTTLRFDNTKANQYQVRRSYYRLQLAKGQNRKLQGLSSSQ